MFSSKKLFSTSLEPSCVYCEHGRQSVDKQSVLCPKKGVVANYYNCGKFLYDPLKRVPKRTPELTRFDPEDFAL